MTKHLYFAKRLFCAALLPGIVGMPATAMDNNNYHQDLEPLMVIVNEDYVDNYQRYHLAAINFIKNDYYATDQNGNLTIPKKPAPTLSEQFGFFGNIENSGGWATAISNFEQPQVMNVYPLPSVDQWPIRGFAKKYNDELLRQVMDHIQKQKDGLLTELSL